MGDRGRHRGPIAFAACATFATGALAMGAVGCGGSEEGTTAAADAGATGVTGRDAPVADTSLCKQVKRSKGSSPTYEAPEQTVKRGEKLTAVVRTSCGAFEIELDTKRSPTTVNSFVFLARKGFYDGLEFDRAAPGTYLHGGDPPGDAAGPGYSVRGEIPSGIIYRYRTVALAQPFGAPNGAAGSQFFVILAKPWIDFSAAYPPLGKVSDGLEVLERINALGPVDKYPGPGNIGGVGEIGKLKRPVLIERVSIRRGDT